MKVVVATPLYPPDIAEPAPYVKELAKRLSSISGIELTIVTYGSLPEKVHGVHIIAVNKRQPLLIRLVTYTFALLKASRSADLIYMQNGASIELPVGIALRFTNKPLVVRIGDQPAHEHARKNALYGMIESFALSRARNIITDAPAAKPEVLPFKSAPTQELAAYEKSWENHLQILKDTFGYA